MPGSRLTDERRAVALNEVDRYALRALAADFRATRYGYVQPGGYTEHALNVIAKLLASEGGS